MLSNLYNLIVVGNQKAVIGFVLAFVGGLGLTVGGINILDVTVREALTAGAAAVITAGGVWIKRNN